MTHPDLETRLAEALHARGELLGDDQLTPLPTARAALERATGTGRRTGPAWHRWAPTLAAAAVVLAASTVVVVQSGRGRDHPGVAAAPSASATESASPSEGPPLPTRAQSGVAPSGSGTAGPLVNETLTDAVRAQLVRAYVRDLVYQPSWISGTVPGSVYYVLDPATGDHLAWASFMPSPTAPEQVVVGMQDEGARIALRQEAGHVAWQVYDICTTPDFLRFVGGVLPAGGKC